MTGMSRLKGVMSKVSVHNTPFEPNVARVAAALIVISLLFAGSCSRTKKDDDIVLREDIYGFFLGQTKDVVFKRADGIAKITRAPEPPMRYRGELWNFSAPLESHLEVDHVRCAFLANRLMEVIVYFRDTGTRNLDRLKFRLEGQFQTNAVADDSRFEIAQKTYRLKGPGMSITLRRITNLNRRTELYVQFIHNELHRELIEGNKSTKQQ
jgi:hypothetical protein